MTEMQESPLNPLPAMVWLFILVIAGVELALVLGAYGWIGPPEALGWRIMLLERFGYSSAVQVWMLESHHAPLRHLWRYVTFGFVHGQTMGAFFTIVILAALGKYLAEPMGNLRFAALALVPPVLAAVLFGLIMQDDATGWLAGGMVMIFGLVGAFTWRRWDLAQGDRASQMRAFSVIAVLLVARLGFGLLAETGSGWIAEIGAFGFGFGLAALIAPGQWTRIRARLRHE
jgi:rhomboid protease GluP